MIRKEMKSITEDGTLDRGEKALPSKIKLYMKRFSDELNKANLNKIKKVAVLYKIIQSLAKKLKKANVKNTKKTYLGWKKKSKSRKKNFFFQDCLEIG